MGVVDALAKGAPGEGSTRTGFRMVQRIMATDPAVPAPPPAACSRCESPIPVEEMASGLAVVVDGESVCSSCVDLLPGRTQVAINRLRALRGLATTTYRVPMPGRPGHDRYTFTTAVQIALHRRTLRIAGRFDAPLLPATDRIQRSLLVTAKARRRFGLAVSLGLGGLALTGLFILLLRSPQAVPKPEPADSAPAPAPATATATAARPVPVSAPPSRPVPDPPLPPPTKASYLDPDPVRAWRRAAADPRCPPALLEELARDVEQLLHAALARAQAATDDPSAPLVRIEARERELARLEVPEADRFDAVRRERDTVGAALKAAGLRKVRAVEAEPRLPSPVPATQAVPESGPVGPVVVAPPVVPPPEPVVTPPPEAVQSPAVGTQRTIPWEVAPMPKGGGAPLIVPSPWPSTLRGAAARFIESPALGRAFGLEVPLDPGLAVGGGFILLVHPVRATRRSLQATVLVGGRVVHGPVILPLTGTDWQVVSVSVPAGLGSPALLRLEDDGSTAKPFLAGPGVQVVGRPPGPEDLGLRPAPLLCGGPWQSAEWKIFRDDLQTSVLLMGQLRRRNGHGPLPLDCTQAKLYVGGLDDGFKRDLRQVLSELGGGRPPNLAVDDYGVGPGWRMAQFQAPKPGCDPLAFELAVFMPNGQEAGPGGMQELEASLRLLAQPERRITGQGVLPVLVLGGDRALVDPGTELRAQQLRLASFLKVPVIDLGLAAGATREALRADCVRLLGDGLASLMRMLRQDIRR